MSHTGYASLINTIIIKIILHTYLAIRTIMNKIDRLTVKYHGEIVGVISLTPDDKRLAFEYDPR